MAELGSDIFFTCWNSASNWIIDFQSKIESYGVRCTGIEINLSDADSISIIFDKIIETLGVPSILVNNAAHSTVDGYLNLDASTLDLHYAVNVRATCLLSVEFARRFKETSQERGSIVNLTSGQALGPMIGELAYVTSKGAISAFTLSLSAEIAALGINVNALNPGPTDTGWMNDEIKQHLLPKFLMGRVGTPLDAANIISFLVSEEARWITGQIINAEGGFLRS